MSQLLLLLTTTVSLRNHRVISVCVPTVGTGGIASFTCLTSRTVHLEIAFPMETDSFLSCLTRFEARYGTPMSYHNDNGTNFVGAKNELSECIRSFDQASIESNLCRRNSQWFFNPPSAPHVGVLEHLVRPAKRALLHVLNGRTLTDEILITALALVSNLLNSRPITAVGDDPKNPEPLTPHHLLLGRANPSLPLDVFTNKDISSKMIGHVLKRHQAAEAAPNPPILPP